MGMELEEPRSMPAGAVGDINSSAKGSGARYNAGKPPLSLIPLRLLAQSLAREPLEGMAQRAVDALGALGEWQESGDVEFLYQALDALGATEGWVECAYVFDYGRKKYAEWNWAKGMQWSVPLDCAARHLVAIIKGELTDPESEKPHRGHVFCNVAMLLTFTRTYTEGDDRPRLLA